MSTMYRASEKQQEDFEEVRRAPTGRASVYVPEISLVRRFKEDPEKKKVNVRAVADVFILGAKSLFTTIKDDVIETLKNIVKDLRHVDDLSPGILVIAAYLFFYYGHENDNIVMLDSKKFEIDDVKEAIYIIAAKKYKGGSENSISTDETDEIESNIEPLDQGTIQLNQTPNPSIDSKNLESTIADIKIDIYTYYSMIMNNNISRI